MLDLGSELDFELKAELGLGLGLAFARMCHAAGPGHPDGAPAPAIPIIAPTGVLLIIGLAYSVAFDVAKPLLGVLRAPALGIPLDADPPPPKGKWPCCKCLLPLQAICRRSRDELRRLESKTK